MDCICPVCQKKFCVLWPTQWALKVKGQYYCSWMCLRADEKGMKEELGATRVPDEAKKKAIQAALNGENPYEFLKPYTKNPSAMWTSIKTMVRKKNPELYAKIPDLRDLKKVKQKLEEAISQVPEVSAADAMAACQDAAEEFFGKCEDMGLKIEAPEEPKICRPVNYDGMMVRAVEGDFGSYHFQEINGKQWIDYDDKELANQLSMTVEQWKGFLKEIYHAAQILGVTL